MLPLAFKTLFIDNWQLLGKLIFSPNQWRQEVAQLDCKLTPDFAFTDLPTDCWTVQQLQRLRYIIFLIQPLWIGITISLLLLLTHSSLENLVLGVSYGMTVTFVAGAIGSFTISLVYGLIGGAMGGLSSGLIVGLAGETANLTAIWFGIFAITMAGSITATLTNADSPRTLAWQLISVLIGLLSLAIILFIGDRVAGLVGQQFIWLNFNEAQIRVIGMMMSLGLILGWRLKGWRFGLTLGLFAGSMMALSISIGYHIIGKVEPQWLENIIIGILGGATNAALFIILFALPYLLALYIADIWAGIVAGILSSASIYLGFIYLSNPETALLQPLFIGSLLAFILGTTQNYWRPIVFYPLTAFWNLSLHLAQQRQPGRSRELFYKHSVFWDEDQFLPLFGLEKQLVTLYHFEPETAIQVMRQLTGTRQNWAVVASQRELDLQTLARCQTIFAIAEVHQSLLTPAQAQVPHQQWLSNFRQGSLDVEYALSLPSNEQQQAALKTVVARLDGLLSGITQTNHTYLRLKAIINHWQSLLDKHIQQLDQVQKIPNPYTFGPPLDKKVHDVFAERPQVITRLQQLLQAHNCPPLLLYGQRRTGKTTLLINMNSLLPANFIMLFIDCQSPIAWAENHASFFYNLSTSMMEAAEKVYPTITYPVPNRAAFEIDAFAEFTNWLTQLEQAVSDKVILLAFDEFITLDMAFTEKRLRLESVLGMFRHLIQHRPRFRLLFAGTHTFKELEHWAGYFIGVQIIHLSYLLDTEARRLIEQPIKYFPLRYTPQAVERILTLTHSHPALLQLLCSELVQIKDNQPPHQRFQVEIADIEAAIPSALQFGEFFFADIKQNQINKLGLQCLNLIAAQGEGAIVNANQLLALFANEQELQNTVELLLQRELIEQIQEPVVGYRFQVELIRRWFLEHR